MPKVKVGLETSYSVLVPHSMAKAFRCDREETQHAVLELEWGKESCLHMTVLVLLDQYMC